MSIRGAACLLSHELGGGQLAIVPYRADNQWCGGRLCLGSRPLAARPLAARRILANGSVGVRSCSRYPSFPAPGSRLLRPCLGHLAQLAVTSLASTVKAVSRAVPLFSPLKVQTATRCHSHSLGRASRYSLLSLGAALQRVVNGWGCVCCVPLSTRQKGEMERGTVAATCVESSEGRLTQWHRVVPA